MNLKLPKHILEQVAKAYKDALVKEALKDFAKRGWSCIDTETGLHLKDSFKITVSNGVSMSCSFPMILLWLEGMSRQKMDWVPKGVPIPMENEEGEVIFRMLPLKTQKVWIHPGIKKFAFLQRAMQKGKIDSDKILSEFILKNVLSANRKSN
jgi:hypothetical protein